MNKNGYKATKMTEKEIAIANIDKLSFNKRGSKKTYTPFGIVKLYSNKNGKRWFSVSMSKFLHNGGSYTKTSLRLKISAI